MAKQQNQVFAEIELCGEAVSAQSQVSEVDVIDLTINKEADCAYVLVGGNICYTVTITNSSDVDFANDELGGVIFRDPLASNVTYVENSFNYTINDGSPDPQPVYVEPSINADNVMTYDNIELEAGHSAVVKFCVKVNQMPSADDDDTDDE